MNIYNLDKGIEKIFTGFCKEKNHLDKLEYFCKTHNKLCCSGCIDKIKREGKGQHTDCDICLIEDIKDTAQKIEKMFILPDYLQAIKESVKFKKIEDTGEILSIDFNRVESNVGIIAVIINSFKGNSIINVKDALLKRQYLTVHHV